MAVYEIQVVRGSGTIDTRYSDRSVKVGDRFTIDARELVVVRRIASPSNPLASAAFLCAEATAPALPVRSRPEARRAA